MPGLLPDEILKLPVPELRSGETRMQDARKCRELVRLSIREDQIRSQRRAATKGCYDGNPPMSKTPPGYAWTCNLNFGEMEGLMDAARVPYYALLNGVQTYTVFKTGYDRQNPQNDRWNQIIGEEWTEMLNRWKPFRWHNRVMEFEMLFEGWGPLIFESPTDWRFTSIPARCVKVPKEAYSVIDERLPWIVVLRDFRVHELWEKISDEKAATDRGWDIEQVKYAIVHACNRNTNSSMAGQVTGQDWEYWQKQLKNGDYCVSYTQSDVIRCSFVFLKEYGKDGKPGRISQFLVTVDDVGAPVDRAADEVPENYLFRDINKYETYQEVINVCFQNTGDGTWHSVRGLAMKAFKHVEVSNRLMCRAVDNAFLAAGPIVQPGTNQAKDQLQMAVLGPITTLAKDATFIQHRLAADVQGVLAVGRTLSNNLAQNIGQYNQRSLSREDGRGEQPTATAVELQAGKETSLKSAQIDAYYDDRDTLYEQMWERARKGLDEESRRFLKNCYDRGVPKEAIDQMQCIKANRMSGYPSPEMRKRNYREGYSLYPSLPTQGKQAMLNEGISLYFGPDKVEIFNPPMEEPDVDSAWAQQENAGMVIGVKPELVSGMNPVTHLQVHLGFAKERLQPLNDQMDQQSTLDPAELEEAYRFVAILGPHCEEHLAQLQSNPAEKGNYELFSLQLKNLVAFHGKLRGAILDARREAQQAALEEQQATALGVMDKAKLASMEAEVQRKNISTAADIRRKDVKADHSNQLSTYKAQSGVQLKGATTLANIQIDKAKTIADTAIKADAKKAA